MRHPSAFEAEGLCYSFGTGGLSGIVLSALPAPALLAPCATRYFSASSRPICLSLAVARIRSLNSSGDRISGIRVSLFVQASYIIYTTLHKSIAYKRKPLFHRGIVCYVGIHLPHSFT